jgi:uncharacterized protein YpmS
LRNTPRTMTFWKVIFVLMSVPIFLTVFRPLRGRADVSKYSCSLTQITFEDSSLFRRGKEIWALIVSSENYRTYIGNGNNRLSKLHSIAFYLFYLNEKTTTFQMYSYKWIFLILCSINFVVFFSRRYFKLKEVNEINAFAYSDSNFSKIMSFKLI